MAGFNINRFRAEGLVGGGARPTNFAVTLAFPGVVDAPGASAKMQMLCRSSKLPESMIADIPIPYFGRTIKIAGNRTFDDWDVTIMNDEDFMLRNLFEKWHNSINTLISNRLDPAAAGINAIGGSYKTTALVTQFGKSGPGDIDGEGAIKTYKFEGVFPTMVSDIPLDYDAVNQIEQFQVRFAYDWYEPYTKANDEPIFPLELNDA